MKVCHSIEKLFRNFLWSANSSQTKRNLINWKTICLPKNEGGLGLRRVKEMNEACMLKLGWLAMTSSSIWAIWFRDRYFKNRSIWNPKSPKAGSCIWKSIRRLAPWFQKSFSRSVGDGKLISTWYDNWLHNFPIATSFPQFRLSQFETLSALISDQNWVIPNNLSAPIREQLMAATLPSLPQPPRRDSLIWNGSSSSNFTISVAWNLIRTRASKVPWF